MSTIQVELSGFSDEQDGDREFPYTSAAIVRASVAAGRNPKDQPTRAGERAELKSREFLVRSAVNLRSNQPRATETYLDTRMTSRGHMTEAVANALCAFSAQAEFNIPWLMNIEELNRYSVRPVIKRANGESRKRTDFIGIDKNKEWYAFEAKGRMKKPSEGQIEDWKEEQAKTISTINGRTPKHHIVAVTYLNEDNIWSQSLNDPPADKDGVSAELDERSFFIAYYVRLQKRFSPNRIVDETPVGALYSVGIPGFYVGVNAEFVNAAFEGAVGRLFELSSSIGNRTGEASEAGLHIFPDGIMVRAVQEPSL